LSGASQFGGFFDAVGLFALSYIGTSPRILPRNTQYDQPE
jgi:hypothetical protein